jgi:hypothetical protein
LSSEPTPSITGGEDPGRAFDAYLAMSRRVASWAADLHGRSVGPFDRGTSGAVEPVVVTDPSGALGGS